MCVLGQNGVLFRRKPAAVASVVIVVSCYEEGEEGKCEKSIYSLPVMPGTAAISSRAFSLSRLN